MLLVILQLQGFLELSLSNVPEDPDVLYALGRWHYKVWLSDVGYNTSTIIDLANSYGTDSQLH